MVQLFERKEKFCFQSMTESSATAPIGSSVCSIAFDFAIHTAHLNASKHKGTTFPQVEATHDLLIATLKPCNYVHVQ